VNAYEESITSEYNSSFTTPNGNQFQLTNQFENLIQPFFSPAPPGAGVIAPKSPSQMWINRTAGCTGVNSCPVTYNVCLGVTASGGGPKCNWIAYGPYANAPPSVTTGPKNVQVLGLYVNWTHTNNLANQPAFTVTRLFVELQQRFQGWIVQGSNDLGFNNVTVFNYKIFGTSFVPTYWSVRQVTWWVPYPAGNWYLAGTTFQSVDYSVTYGSSYYDTLTGAVLVQWGAFPTDYVTNYTYHYLFTLVAVAGSGGGGGGGHGCIVSCGGGGGGGGTGGNGSGAPPGSPPNPAPQIGELVLMLGNVTAQSGGGFLSSLIYTNLYAYNLTCEIILEASWLSTATNVTVFVNGVPLPVFDRGVSSTLITIWSGVVTIGTGTSVSFSATFQLVSSFSFYGTLFYLGSTPVNVWNIVAVGALVTTAFVIWWDIRNPARSRLQDGITGTGLFALYVLCVVTL